MARPATCLLQNPLHTLPHIVSLRIEHGRVEIALNGDLPQALPGLVQLDAEIDPDDVTPGLTHQFQQRTGARAKVDRRYARGQVRQHGPRVRQYEGAVISRREGPDPAIEQL